MIAPAKRLTTWQRHEKKKNRHFKTVRRAVAKALNKQFGVVLEVLKSGLQPTETLILPTALQELYPKIYRLVGSNFAEYTYQQVAILTKANPERKSLFQRAMEQFAFTQAAERVQGITDTTKAFVRAVLAKGTEEGWGIQKLAREMRQRWNILTRYRATLISRTEINAAAAHGAIVGAKEAQRATGIRLDKIWLAKIDGRVRDSHAGAHRQRVGMDELFTVNGYQMAKPGDTSNGAPVGEVVNCRCTLIFQRARG